MSFAPMPATAAFDFACRLVYDESGLVHVATAGVMAIGGPPMRRDALFRISSTTRPITAALVLALVDAGRLELDEPVDEILPELADRRVLLSPDGPIGQTVPARRSITVRDLLTFTWGFGMQGAMFMAPEPWPIVIAAAERELSTFGPPRPASMPWSHPPRIPDGSGLVSSADDLVAFGRMLIRGGSPVLKPATVAEMTRDQLTATQRANVWPGFSFLEGRGRGYGLSTLDGGRYTWEGGLGTAWSNVPAEDLTVVVLTQRAADETGMPAVCDDVLTAARVA